MSKYEELVGKLKEIFQIDRPELDFGVYRILNTRSEEISNYLETELRDKVTSSFNRFAKVKSENLRNSLKEKETQYRADGVNPNTVPIIENLRKEIRQLDVTGLDYQNVVFSHLITFFSRYYVKGDFISQRRYKGDTYSIPYSGDEVVLYWANRDQYYTKSGENFSNFAFKLADGRSVQFCLVAADTAKDNRKDNDKNRLFALIDRHLRTLIDDDGNEYEQEYLPVEENGNELTIRFEYKDVPKGSKQEDLVAKAVTRILDDQVVKSRWLELSRREPTEKNPHRTLLEKCLTRYTTKNTADYFIHKDLAGFLKRELDFYIKNEVMYLDDIQSVEYFADVEKSISIIQTLRSIALDLITFLGQLEDLQKALWLKKKFVVSTNYCLTLDRVPTDLFEKIAANKKQWEQWQNLGLLDHQSADLLSQTKVETVEYLKSHQYLMIDTSLFDDSFKQSVLASIQDLDESMNGLLIHSDNFQALNLLSERYRRSIDSVYIDPPYNTNASVIVYKNGFRHSSWLSLMESRLEASKPLLAENSITCVAIDDVEYPRLKLLIDKVFGSVLGVAAVKSNPAGRSTARGFSSAHEYAIFASNSEESRVGRLPRTEKQQARYSEKDEIGRFEWVNFRKHGGVDAQRFASPKMFYPIFAQDGRVRAPKLRWNKDSLSWELLEQPLSTEEVIWPINEAGQELRWKRGLESFTAEVEHYIARPDRSGKTGIYMKSRMSEEGMLPLTWWDKKSYSATDYGTNLLTKIFGKIGDFSFPKSLHLVIDSLKVANLGKTGLVLDYFAGSGTTAHAVLSMNREDSGNRQYILIEQGEYFETVTKPRVQKITYSADWKNGRPTAPQTGQSQAFKVIQLESYEDALNNISLVRSEPQQKLLDSMPNEVKQQYLLRYMLDVESRSSILSVEKFSKPFNFRMKVTIDSAGAFEERKIDLVETFNYLIGLSVQTVNMQLTRGFATVTGKLPSNEKALVLWRDVELLPYDDLDRLCKRLAINPADSEFDVVYINGDHNIPAAFTTTEDEGGITKTLKVRQIESEFIARMFVSEG